MNTNDYLIPQADLPPRPTTSLPLQVISMFTITSMLVFLILADVLIHIYQAIYFRINAIPQIKRNNYVKMGRYKLAKLTLMQKWSCAYCEYANGIILWLKAVANQTEIYSCAIKYSYPLPGQDYQTHFYEQNTFKIKTDKNVG
ncbi:hypothetical protein BH09PAT1_BH09PAT1_8530 [soil metagenome]